MNNKFDRRRFNTSVLAFAGISGITTITVKQKDVLIIEFADPLDPSELDMIQLAFARIGFDSDQVVIINGAKTYKVGSRSTFHHYLNENGDVLTRGKVLSNVLWCDTKTGLVCRREQLGKPGTEFVSVYPDVTFEQRG